MVAGNNPNPQNGTMTPALRSGLNASQMNMRSGVNTPSQNQQYNQRFIPGKTTNQMSQPSALQHQIMMLQKNKESMKNVIRTQQHSNAPSRQELLEGYSQSNNQSSQYQQAKNMSQYNRNNELSQSMVVESMKSTNPSFLNNQNRHYKEYTNRTGHSSPNRSYDQNKRPTLGMKRNNQSWEQENLVNHNQKNISVIDAENESQKRLKY